MKSAKFKQIACIAETDPDRFQTKVNAILSHTANPEIIFDKVQPYTMYVVYTVHKNEPESFLELLEMLDPNGGKATCSSCPYFQIGKDRRRKWGTCTHKDKPANKKGRACELYYLMLRGLSESVIEEYEQIPYMIDGAQGD